MKFRPTYTCCGCMSLLIGVEAICLTTMLVCTSVIAIASSREEMRISNVVVSPSIQMTAAAWCLIGIPLTIAGGVGALYRIESNLRAFFWWLLVSFFLGISVPVYFLVSGSLCSSFVSPEVQRMGTAFVCSFTDTFVFFWTMILGAIHLYIVYIVWSAAEQVAETPFPELMKYSDVLRGLAIPNSGAGPFPVNSRAVPVAQIPQNAPVASNFAAPQQVMQPPPQGVTRLNNGPPTMTGLKPFEAYQGQSSMSTAVPSGMMPSYMPSSYAAMDSGMPVQQFPSQGAPQSFAPMPASGFSPN